VISTDGADRFPVEVLLPGRDRLEPGEEAEVSIRLWGADLLPGPLEMDTRLSLSEGDPEIASGTLLSYERHQID